MKITSQRLLRLFVAAAWTAGGAVVAQAAEKLTIFSSSGPRARRRRGDFRQTTRASKFPYRSRTMPRSFPSCLSSSQAGTPPTSLRRGPVPIARSPPELSESAALCWISPPSPGPTRYFRKFRRRRWEGVLRAARVAADSGNYNDKAMQKNGFQYPTTWSEVLELCKAASAKGLIPYAFGAQTQSQNQMLPMKLIDRVEPEFLVKRSPVRRPREVALG